MHDEHQNHNDDDDHHVDDKMLKSVNKKPVYGVGVVVNLRHQTACLASRKEGEGKTLNGCKNGFLQIINHFRRNTRADGSRNHREDGIDHTCADDDGQDEQDIAEKHSRFRQHFIIEKAV